MKKWCFSLVIMLSLCLIMSACGSQVTEDESYSPDAGSASSGISDHVSEYGLLTEYDVASRELIYMPIEIIEESDTERIKELKEQGIELEFPNGHFVYQSSEIQLSFPVDESVSVSLLNDEFTLEQSSIDSVADRLEGHPPFFLCKLDFIEGRIVGIEEYFVP